MSKPLRQPEGLSVYRLVSAPKHSTSRKLVSQADHTTHPNLPRVFHQPQSTTAAPRGLQHTFACQLVDGLQQAVFRHPVVIGQRAHGDQLQR